MTIEELEAKLETVTRTRDEARDEARRLTDERDELLVRVADQGAELRATRAAYGAAYRRGAEAMRGACVRVVDAHWAHVPREAVLGLPIPGEP